jgi:hypothetical protein
MSADAIIESRFPLEFKGFAAFLGRINGRESAGIALWQHGG